MPQVENEVFMDNAPIGKATSNSKPKALSDSSNKGEGSKFPFKKPTPLVSVTKNKLVSTETPKFKKLRSNSVPQPGQPGGARVPKNKCFSDFFDDGYPEPEFLRDISEQTFISSLSSPFQIDLDEPGQGFVIDEELLTESDSSSDGDDDADYPEIERFSTAFNDDSNLGTLFMSISIPAAEKEHISISEPPNLIFEDTITPLLNDWLSSPDWNPEEDSYIDHYNYSR